MLSHRSARPNAGRVLGVLLAASLATVALAAPRGRVGTKSPAAPDSGFQRTPLVALPVARDTRANLQTAFTNEMNAKTRYDVAARQAVREGYPYVAQLFRACSRAEKVHADQHVHAIAWTGGEARATLNRLVRGTTRDNLRWSIEIETYEATQLYPALVAQARSDRQPAAVRSMNFALAAEREHAELMAAALRTLDQRLPVQTFYVCPTCGKTIEALTFETCPNCFTPTRKFVRVD